jgi:2-methylcitrate dehydratase PrpD
MTSHSATLSTFAHDLSLKAVPSSVISRAKACMVDTLGVSVFGSQFPWSQSIKAYARAYGQGGCSQVFGESALRLHAPQAALANGAFAHAFEQDSLRKPGAGVHPGATLFPPALAMAQERNVDGATLLKAFIAACEVMFRIGAASKHSSEQLGFHAPGLTGPFGAAMASGLVMGLDEKQLVSALGIAGSLSGGLLAFSKAKQGAEVKRLHLGRACESGVMAASLAEQGFQGPESILEGRFGFLNSYCAQSAPELLTQGLGTDWETLKICIKAYACHVTAHPAIESLTGLMQEHLLSAEQIEHVRLEVGEKILSHHDIRAPKDIKQAQYSVPFCLSLAMHHNLQDPSIFNDQWVTDAKVLRTCRDLELIGFTDDAKRGSWASRLTLTLKNGQTLVRESDTFMGSPEKSLTTEQLKNRFELHTSKCNPHSVQIWFDALMNLESIGTLRDLPDLFQE